MISQTTSQLSEEATQNQRPPRRNDISIGNLMRKNISKSSKSSILKKTRKSITRKDIYSHQFSVLFQTQSMNIDTSVNLIIPLQTQSTRKDIYSQPHLNLLTQSTKNKWYNQSHPTP
jgi:hypothetical protein